MSNLINSIKCAFNLHRWELTEECGPTCSECGQCALMTRKCRRCGVEEQWDHIGAQCRWVRVAWSGQECVA